MSWTEEQVLALSPDNSSSEAGRDLAKPEKWISLNYNNKALWGELKGSGKNPYQTQIDLQNIAFKCTCPSRKFPCKHGLGIFLIYARSIDLFQFSETMPQWVEDWISKRTEKEQKKPEPEDKKAPDPAAQNKRATAREAKVSAGIEELRLWIKDLIRNGLIGIQEKSHEYWEQPAARMIDAQAPGLSLMVRRLGEINYFSENWQSEVLQHLLRIYLLTESYMNLNQHSEELQKEVRQLIGWTENQEELKKQTGIADDWMVLSKHTNDEETLISQRCWLKGKTSGKTALILNFYHQSFPSDIGLIPGSSIHAELVFYPGTSQQRALIKTKTENKKNFIPEALPTINSGKKIFNRFCRETHWAEEFPVVIDNVIFTKLNEEWYCSDTEKTLTPVHPSFENHWRLMALTGGNPAKISGIISTDYFLPLGVWINSTYNIL
jgi:uncharacterized Zn finger protein